MDLYLLTAANVDDDESISQRFFTEDFLCTTIRNGPTSFPFLVFDFLALGCSGVTSSAISAFTFFGVHGVSFVLMVCGCDII